jgi:hypothetical protein
MESKFASETFELENMLSVNVSCTMVGGISGQGGSGGATELIKVIPLWVLVDYVG